MSRMKVKEQQREKLSAQVHGSLAVRLIMMINGGLPQSIMYSYSPVREVGPAVNSK